MQFTISKIRIIPKVTAMLVLLLLLTPALMARQGGGKPPQQSSFDDPMVLTMVIIMLILLLAIGLLAYVVTGAATVYREREKEREQKDHSTETKIAGIAMLLLIAGSLQAQGDNPVEQTAQAVSQFGSLSATAFYFMISVIAVEVMVIFVLIYQLQVFLGKEKVKKELAPVKSKPLTSIWNKLNRFRPVEQDVQLDLGHDYDGIRELDNRLPPWWLYGFYITIVVGAIYLWRYHVSETAPLSIAEYQIAMKEAEVQNEAYLKKAANNIDEHSVKLIADASTLENAKTLFVKNCAACHGKSGEGIVGPNLTDDYWLHGGNVKDVFKTIKYGIPEKGMRSWKDDFSPSQMAQISSYIKSLHGTNPPNAKEKQGDRYQDSTATAGNPASISITNK